MGASARTWIGIGVFVAVLVAIAVFVQLDGGAAQETYNGFPLARGTCPGTDVECFFVSFAIRDEPYTISFYHHPASVEDVPIAPQALRAVYQFQAVPNGSTFIAVPKDAPGQIGVAAVEVARLLGQRYRIFNLNAKGAAIGTDEGEVSCASADSETLVVLFEQGPITAATERVPNCVVLSATDEDEAVRVADAFSYALLGVTQVVR